jgi:hypothetical protein
MASAGSVPGIEPIPVAEPAGQGNGWGAAVSCTLLSLVFAAVTITRRSRASRDGRPAGSAMKGESEGNGEAGGGHTGGPGGRPPGQHGQGTGLGAGRGERPEVRLIVPEPSTVSPS